jgi:hypothetical protein
MEIQLTSHRVGHSATLLEDGRVLVVGGGRVRPANTGVCDIGNPGSLATAEIVDPTAGTSAPTSSLCERREHHRATRLGDGSVLITGGMLDIG